ncbi:hypothetical protein DAPPUDRAFT_109262 [Daphnia pulex]|uniref:Integrase zinc-binding domain-containing protein n=1 Tax=Daphnia pulex TaxID=6669 RepID=E9H2G5_DAPPU|nr:hypothetical protein DAPPUDRAFT_109262 [Daphnia pulex]|eukprot:EFX73975.1 hypothetical protein DAPPUDRAFT_109262 [Daphnia pulex]
MVLNRPVRDALPTHSRSFAPEWQQKTDVLEKRARRAKEVQIEHYNKTAHQLPPFSIGDHVIIQHPISKCWSTPAVVVEIGPHRDYLLKTPAGRLFRRNHRMHRKRIPVMPGISTPTPIPPEPIPVKPGTTSTTKPTPPTQKESPKQAKPRQRGKPKPPTFAVLRRSTRTKKKPDRYTN